MYLRLADRFSGKSLLVSCRMADVFGKIVLAYDGSDNARKALSFAIKLAKNLGDELITVTAVDISHLYGEGVIVPQEAQDKSYQRAHELLDDAVKEARSQGVEASSEVLDGEASNAIMEFAGKNGAGLIITGSRGLSAAKRFFLGSISTRIVQESKIPVLVIK